MRKMVLWVLTVTLLTGLCACSIPDYEKRETESVSAPLSEMSETTEPGAEPENSVPAEAADHKAAPGYVCSDEVTDYVDIRMDSGKHMVLKLRPDVAPITVANFQKLVGEGFYNGLIFHRVIPGFMIQGGDPDGTGAGGASETIKGEFAGNGVENPLSHKAGVLSMARSMEKNSASSQFFICHADSTFLDGEYAAFGELLLGQEVVDEIANLPRDASDRPNQPPVMSEVFFVQPEA